MRRRSINTVLGGSVCAATLTLLFVGPAAAQALVPSTSTPGTPKTVAAPGPVTPDAKTINPTGKDISLTVPLREIGPLGQVDVILKANGDILIREKDFANAVSRLVRPDALTPLATLAGPEGFVSTANLTKHGFVISYDPNSVELAVQIPLSARLGGTVNVGPVGNDVVQPDLSAAFASYLNYRIGENYNFDNAGNTTPAASFLANLEWSGRLFNTVAFENFATVDQRNSSVFERSASRLIYDLPGPSLRFTAGDLLSEGTGFQSTPQISGLNVSHLINTFYPSAWIAGDANRTLNLVRASDIQLLVNNQTVSQLHLNPGTYDLRSLPVTQGANNVKAIITDDSGQRIEEDFNFFSDVNLLTPGLDEYTASLGVLSPLNAAGPVYHTSEPAFSGFYRRGWTTQLTAGGNAQASRVNQLLGLDAVLGTNLGLFSLNVAGNRQTAGEMGYGGWFRYRYQDQDSVRQGWDFTRTIDFSTQYQSPYFTSVSDTQFAGTPLYFNPQAITFSATVNQPLLRDLELEITTDYNITRDSSNSVDVSALLNYELPFDATLGAGVSYQFSGGAAASLAAANATAAQTGTAVVTPFTVNNGLSFLINLTYRIDNKDVVTSSADRFQQQLNYTRSPLAQIGDVYANADIDHVNSQITASGTAAYETARGDGGVQYNNTLTEQGSVTGQQAGVFFDGSIGLAGGHVGIGRHVSDAFGVVAADPTLADNHIVVEANGTATPTPLAEASPPLGATVLPLSSYNKQVLPYEVPDAPAGYDLGPSNFEVYPWLHSGFALKVGSPYNATALGTLLDAGGAPVSLRSGQAVSLVDPKAPPVDVITNRTGRFAAPGLAIGRYRLTIAGNPPLVYEFSVIKTQDLLTRLDSIRPVTAAGGNP